MLGAVHSPDAAASEVETESCIPGKELSSNRQWPSVEEGGLEVCPVLGCSSAHNSFFFFYKKAKAEMDFIIKDHIVFFYK